MSADLIDSLGSMKIEMNDVYIALGVGTALVLAALALDRFYHHQEENNRGAPPHSSRVAVAALGMLMMASFLIAAGSAAIIFFEYCSDATPDPEPNNPEEVSPEGSTSCYSFSCGATSAPPAISLVQKAFQP